MVEKYCDLAIYQADYAWFHFAKELAVYKILQSACILFSLQTATDFTLQYDGDSRCNDNTLITPSTNSILYTKQKIKALPFEWCIKVYFFLSYLFRYKLFKKAHILHCIYF